MSASVLRFPRRVPQCEHCGWLVPPGSATEIAQHERCTLPQDREARLAEARTQWRCEDRERLRKGRGVPIREPSAPLPPPRLHKAVLDRLTRLRWGLADPMMHPALVAMTGLPLAALQRVASGRSTLAPAQWQRLRAVLGTGVVP